MLLTLVIFVSLASYTIVLSNNTFRAEIPLAGKVFVDIANTNTLSLYLYDAAGNELPKSSWVSLKTPQQILNIYSSKAIFDLQPSGGFTFKLSAIDSSGTENHMNLKISLNGPITQPNYLRTLVSLSLSCKLCESTDLKTWPNSPRKLWFLNPNS